MYPSLGQLKAIPTYSNGPKVYVHATRPRFNLYSVATTPLNLQPAQLSPGCPISVISALLYREIIDVTKNSLPKKLRGLCRPTWSLECLPGCAQGFNTSHSTVLAMNKRFDTNGTVANRPRSGSATTASSVSDSRAGAIGASRKRAVKSMASVGAIMLRSAARVFSIDSHRR